MLKIGKFKSFKCHFICPLLQILSIVAILSGEEIFVNCHTSENRADALTAHARFENKNGDHLTLLNAFKTYSNIERVKVWCQENFLNSRNLAYASQVRKQLSDICERIELELSSCGNNFDQVYTIEMHRRSSYTTIFTNSFLITI